MTVDKKLLSDGTIDWLNGGPTSKRPSKPYSKPATISAHEHMNITNMDEHDHED